MHNNHNNRTLPLLNNHHHRHNLLLNNISNNHHNPPIQPYPSSHLAPGRANSPPSKRQRLEKAPSNGPHSRKYSRSSSTKERKIFSDFRVSKIKVGNFTSGSLTP